MIDHNRQVSPDEQWCEILAGLEEIAAKHSPHEQVWIDAMGVTSSVLSAGDGRYFVTSQSSEATEQSVILVGPQPGELNCDGPVVPDAARMTGLSPREVATTVLLGMLVTHPANLKDGQPDPRELLLEPATVIEEVWTAVGAIELLAEGKGAGLTTVCYPSGGDMLIESELAYRADENDVYKPVIRVRTLDAQTKDVIDLVGYALLEDSRAGCFTRRLGSQTEYHEPSETTLYRMLEALEVMLQELHLQADD